MKTTLSTNQIADALRSDEYAGWSYAGSMAMAEYLEELEEDCGVELELDVVAIRCDFSEYEDLIDWAKCYWGTLNKEEKYIEHFGFTGEDEDEQNEIIREYIQDNGQLIEFDGGVIVSSF